MSQTRSNFQFVPDKQDPLILTKAADLVCYGLQKKTNYQRTQGMVGAPCCLVNRGQPLSSKLLRSGIAAGQGSRFMNGKMLGLVIVIPVDGRNLKNQLIGPVVYPIVYMVCLILLFSSTNSDLPFIHVICWLVILVLPCSRC